MRADKGGEEMINGIYRIVMSTPIGKKYGSLALCEYENRLTGCLDMLGHKNDIYGSIQKDGRCQLIGEFITLVRNIKFQAEGFINEHKLEFLIHAGEDTMSLSGELIDTKKGAE